MRGQRTVTTYCTSPTQLKRPEPTLHDRHGPTHSSAGQAGHWAGRRRRTTHGTANNTTTTRADVPKPGTRRNNVPDRKQVLWGQGHRGHHTTQTGRPLANQRLRTNTTQLARPGRNTSTAPDRPAAATLRTEREDNKNNVRLHRRRLYNRLSTKLLQNNDPTMNRPHASRPTPDRLGMQGTKRKRRPLGWRQHAAPRPPITIPKNTTQHRNSTIMNPTNQC